MFTLPAEVTNNKDKISTKPIILIDFVDLAYSVGSKSFTLIVESGDDGFTDAESLKIMSSTVAAVGWNGAHGGDELQITGEGSYLIDYIDGSELHTTTDMADGSNKVYAIQRTHYDLIKKGDKVGISTSLSESIADVSSVSNLTINLTDWRNTLRSNLVGSAPDLTGSEVKVYIKFDATDNDYDNILQIYYGKITDYKINKDIMTLSIKNHDPIAGDYPIDLLVDEDSQSIAADDVIKPLQYGDFLWDYDLRYWGDVAGQGSLAICPLHLASESELVTAEWTTFVAGHEMNTMIGIADQTWLTTLTTDLPTLFTYRGKELNFLQVIAWETTGIYNTSTDCYMIPAVRTASPILAHIMRPLLAAGASNDTDDWANAVDGKASTSAVLDQSDNILHVKTCDFDDITGVSLNNSSDDVEVFVFLGTVTGTDYHVIDYSDDGSAWHVGVNVNSTTSDKIVMFSLDNLTIEELEDLNDLHIRVTQNAISENTIEIKNIVVMPRVDDVSSSDKYLHLRCKGREYSGTWESRKTAGNIIDNPIDVIESVLRDEMSITDIDTASFDALHTEFDTHSLVPHISIFQQKDWRNLLRDLCQDLQVALIPTLTNSWRVVSYDTSVMMFASSGTDSPGAQDIFTDTDVISSGVYTNHPILKGSFKLSRSSVGNVFGTTTLNYKYTGDTYLESSSVGSGNPVKYINSNSVGNATAAANLAAIMGEWWNNQKYIATFKTFYNAIAHEAGDCINIRHGDLNDDMLDATVNTQKWMIIKLKPSWHPNQIEITAIELRDPTMP